jgi:LacI family transcriptional regulator
MILRQRLQQLVMTKPVRIGLAVLHSYAFDRGILRGIARYAESKPAWVFTSVVPEQQPWQALGRFRPAGLIASVYSNELVRVLSGWCGPVVDVYAVLPGLRFPNVRVDNEPVGRLAAAHFLERGLRQFGYIGPPHQLFSVERRAAFCRALEQSGHAVACYHTSDKIPFDPLGRRWDLDRGIYRWLRKLPKPVGVFVPGDDWGVQVAEACRQVGLRVPEDVALLGVDDDDLDCELSRPRLSSVRLPTERIGYEAAALLDRLLAGAKPPPAPILLPPTGVATRRSTEMLAIDDPDVVAAVRFIREQAHLPIRVDDVLREAPVGRRTLERRFHKALGWGLGEEIRRAHLERARRLLARTDLPMKVVAEQAGFSGIRHMGVVFRQELGLPPTAYRRQLSGFRG